MANSDLEIVYLLTVPSFGRKFPLQHPSKKELEIILQDAFGTWGKRVIDDYFVESSEYYPQNLAFFVVPYHQKGTERHWLGCLIATKEEVDGFAFTYYDKIGVIKQYQGNGIMPKMIHLARQVSDGKNVKPSILRTSEKKLDKIYGEESDIRTEVNGFYIHGFGFRDKVTRKELFEGAEDKFAIATKYVALKPKTVVSIQPSTSVAYQ